MNKKVKNQRFLALFLTMCMLFSVTGDLTVYATELGSSIGEQSLEESTVAEKAETTPKFAPYDGRRAALQPGETSTASEPVRENDNLNEEGGEAGNIESSISLANSDSSIGFSAGIYADANRTTLITSLTAGGATLKGWEFNSESDSSANKYLGIALSGLPMNGEQYQVVVEMAPALYINQNSDPTATSTSVSFARNDPLTVNTDGQYVPKTYSLKNLTYLIDKGTERLTFGLPLRFDVNLWNKQSGGLLGDGTDPLLRVYLQEKQADGSFMTVDDYDVNLLQASVSGSVPYAASHSMHIVGGSSTATNNMGADDKLSMSFSRFGNSVYSGGHYDGEIKVQFTLPSCTVDGTKYIMQYKDFSFQTAGGTSAFFEDYDQSTGVLTLEAENLYFNSINLFQMVFYAPDEMKSIRGNHRFEGFLTVTADGVTIAENRSIVINLDTNTQAILKTFSNAGAANVIELDTVQPFGNLAIQNDAAFENGSGPLVFELTFDANETGAVAVTTVNLMCDRDTEWIDIAYTLVDDEGNPAYPDLNGNNQEFTMTVKNKHYSPGGIIGHNTYQTFTRGDLPEEYQKYYFKTLKYTMGNLPGNSKAYHSGAGRAPYSAGTIWGYVTTNTLPDQNPNHTLVVYQANSDGSTVPLGLTQSVTTVMDNGKNVPYGIENAKISAATVTAGDSVTIDGKIFVAGYPYSSNNCLNNIRIGIVLPWGVTVNAASISAKYAGGTLAVKNVSSELVNEEDALYLHVIEFEQGQKIGFYNERLSALANGSEITFSVQLNSEKAMSTQTISLKESVFVAGWGLNNSSSGTYGDHAIRDTYDLNDNGSMSDRVACFGNETTQSITFQSPPAQLIITDDLSKANGESGASLTMESFADTINYNLNIQCTEGGSASEFYYIIPIAKMTMTMDDDFVTACQVDLKLKDSVIITTNNGTAMKVLYSTTVVNDYSGALTITDWSETLPAEKTWEDVTMLKVVSSENVFVNGSVNTISVPLGYAGEDTDYEKMAGMQIRWSSRGYYSYNIGYNNKAGTESTEGCNITLTYTRQDPICFTLTAAKGEPQGQGASKSYSFELPQFIMAQEYSVKQITPHNVRLMDSSYDFSKVSSAEANENFRINISVKDSAAEATGSSPIAIEKDNTIVCSLAGDTAPEFTFTLENADAISDIVTERYVTLTLIGNKGVIVPVIITIQREMAVAEPTKSAIVAGKLYAPFEDEEVAVVSNDSSFTAQFVAKYVPANYTDRTLVFGKEPAEGTTILMIDWTDPNALGFYQYSLDGNTSSIKLTLFRGLSDGEGYVEPAAADIVTERLLFVVSFPENGEELRENTMTLTKEIKMGTDDTPLPELKVITVADRNFTLISSVDSHTQPVEIGESFTLRYTSACSVTDSRYTDRALSLVVGTSEGNILPSDSELVVDGKSYYLNSEGTFLVPLKDIQSSKEGTVTVEFHSQTVMQATLQVELWASATSNGTVPMMGEPVAGPVMINLTARTMPSFKVNSMSRRLFRREDLARGVIVDFAVKDDTSITVEVQRKLDAAYVTQTTVLESVDGKTNADAGQGVFYVRNSSNVSLRLSAACTTGTYRLLFKISNSSGTIEVPFNFIILE